MSLEHAHIVVHNTHSSPDAVTSHMLFYLTLAECTDREHALRRLAELRATFRTGKHLRVPPEDVAYYPMSDWGPFLHWLNSQGHAAVEFGPTYTAGLDFDNDTTKAEREAFHAATAERTADIAISAGMTETPV